MATAVVTSKGQITMPQAVRRTLGLEPGDKVDFIPDEAGGYRVVALRKDVHELRGRFAGRAAKRVGLKDMSDAVAAETAARAGRR